MSELVSRLREWSREMKRSADTVRETDPGFDTTRIADGNEELSRLLSDAADALTTQPQSPGALPPRAVVKEALDNAPAPSIGEGFRAIPKEDVDVATDAVMAALEAHGSKPGFRVTREALEQALCDGRDRYEENCDHSLVSEIGFLAGAVAELIRAHGGEVVEGA